MNNITKQLENHLLSISDEDFLREWAEIESLGLVGPSSEDYIKLHKNSFFIPTDIGKTIVSLAYTPLVIHFAEGRVNIELNENYQYAMAA